VPESTVSLGYVAAYTPTELFEVNFCP